MGLASGIVVFVMIWWVVFFMALPIGIHRDKHVERGNDPGAPQQSYLWWKLLGTTLVTILLWFLITAFLSSIHNS